MLFEIEDVTIEICKHLKFNDYKKFYLLSKKFYQTLCNRKCIKFNVTIKCMETIPNNILMNIFKRNFSFLWLDYYKCKFFDVPVEPKSLILQNYSFLMILIQK